MAAVGLLGENRESRIESRESRVATGLQTDRMKPCQGHIKTASVIIINYALIAFLLESLGIAWDRLGWLEIAGGSC